MFHGPPPELIPGVLEMSAGTYMWDLPGGAVAGWEDGGSGGKFKFAE
jgi:hypothetical protein